MKVSQDVKTRFCRSHEKKWKIFLLVLFVAARQTQEWHWKNGINVLPSWPGFFPVLNPIENAWSQMKRKLSKEKLTTIEGIKEVNLGISESGMA